MRDSARLCGGTAACTGRTLARGGRGTGRRAPPDRGEAVSPRFRHAGRPRRTGALERRLAGLGDLRDGRRQRRIELQPAGFRRARGALGRGDGALHAGGRRDSGRCRDVVRGDLSASLSQYAVHGALRDDGGIGAGVACGGRLRCSTLIDTVRRVGEGRVGRKYGLALAMDLTANAARNPSRSN